MVTLETAFPDPLRYRVLLFRVPVFRVFQGPGSRLSRCLQSPNRVLLGSRFSSFLGSHQGPGPRFSGFSRVLVPGFQVFCRVPLGSYQVPGFEFSVFLGSSQGATRVPGSGFLVCPYKQRTKFTVLKNFPSNVWFIRNISIQLRESIPTTIKNMLTASGIKLCYLAFDNIGSFISFSSLILH